MSFQPTFPYPFPSPFPTREPMGISMQAKLDFCMQRIMELECRIRRLESRQILTTARNPLHETTSLETMQDA
jgi:hypothetical protein